MVMKQPPGFREKLVLISESSEADKLALSSEAESLQAKVVLLDREIGRIAVEAWLAVFKILRIDP